MKKFLWYEVFVDSGVIGRLFTHIRNIFICSLIVSIGSHIHNYPPTFLPETPYTQYLGYPLIIIGLFLFIINLLDGINHIMKHQYALFVKIFLILINLILTGWLVMMACVFRIR